MVRMGGLGMISFDTVVLSVFASTFYLSLLLLFLCLEEY